MTSLKQTAFSWIKQNPQNANQLNTEFYCPTSDVFQARLHKMQKILLQKGVLENNVFLIAAIAGEIGNNSFDHNLGNWPDVAGIFFGYDLEQPKKIIALADRGQGVLSTLLKVKPELTTDQQALQTAFLEKISARAPENRGNGLKFVKQSVEQLKIHLTFFSGSAQAMLNKKIEFRAALEKINGCLAIIEF